MSKPAAPSASAPSHLLLIDDNQNGLTCRRTLLQDAGYIVVTASTPEQGLAEFAAGKFDLVITDYKMPKMNGDQVIARIRQDKPETPIILISGLVDALGLNEQNTGADIVISKNATEVTHLVRSVGRLLRRKTPRKPAGAQGATARAQRKSI